MKYKRHIENIQIMELAIENVKRTIGLLSKELNEESKTLIKKGEYDEFIPHIKIEELNDMEDEYTTLLEDLNKLNDNIDICKITLEQLVDTENILNKPKEKKQWKTLENATINYQI